MPNNDKKWNKTEKKERAGEKDPEWNGNDMQMVAYNFYC